MDFETPQNENKTEEENTIENTSSFQEAIANGNLEEAKNWLLENKEKENYGAHWLDHRSRELFKAYREAGDFVSAKTMILLANSKTGQKGRMAVLEKETGTPYNQI